MSVESTNMDDDSENSNEFANPLYNDSRMKNDPFEQNFDEEDFI